MVWKKCVVRAVVAVVIPFSPLCAGTGQEVQVQEKQPSSVEAFNPYGKGNVEWEVSAGHYWSVGTLDSLRRPDVNWLSGSVRVGWMLNDPRGSGILRGNWEFLVGAYGSHVYEGPGSYIAGLDLNLRYNFVQPDSRVVPFMQIGGGGAYSDMADDDEIQNLVGSDVSFEITGTLGLRIMLHDHLALTTYAQYQHFSNAGTASRNRGLNGVGAFIGLSWFME